MRVHKRLLQQIGEAILSITPKLSQVLHQNRDRDCQPLCIGKGASFGRGVILHGRHLQRVQLAMQVGQLGGQDLDAILRQALLAQLLQRRRTLRRHRTLRFVKDVAACEHYDQHSTTNRCCGRVTR